MAEIVNPEAGLKEEDKYWPYGTPPPARLIIGFKAIEDARQELLKIDTSKLTLSEIKNACSKVHLSDIKEAIAKYALVVKEIKVVLK